MIHFLLQPRAVDKRQIGTPQYMGWVGKLLQGTQRISSGGAGNLVVQRPEHENDVSDSFGMPVPLEHRYSLGEKRHRPASVRDDETDIRTAPQRAGKNKI